jgi:DNA-directed RNA polymerase sigma subunit (sigma70/sigma32)
MATKAATLKRVTELAERAHKATLAAEAAQAKRDQAILAARGLDAPATYQEIAEAASITKDRVSQIIQAQRRRA